MHQGPEGLPENLDLVFGLSCGRGPVTVSSRIVIFVGGGRGSPGGKKGQGSLSGRG